MRLKFLLVLALVCLLSVASKADTYKLIPLDIYFKYIPYGITDDGIVVLQATDTCSAPSGVICYASFFNGVYLGTTTAVAPALDYDNGTACSINIPGTFSGSGGTGYTTVGRCNNGHTIFGAMPTVDGRDVRGTFDGFDPIADNIGPLSEDKYLVNRYGDFVIHTISREDSFLAYDVTAHAPEPSSLLLLGSGAMGLIGAVRRRFR